LIDTSARRYLLVGVFNTVFGYALSLLVYHFLQKDVSIIVIGIMINVISITVAFLGYKLFVFKSAGNWLHEYLRCYVTYGFSAVLGIALIWLFVGKWGWVFWFSQGLNIALSTVISYFMHRHFTFR
jgi:putative flippase GtrA